MMLDNYDIQKVRDLPIEQVADALGLQVKHHRALCPFHADTHPSLMFNVRKNQYRCFVCGANGSTISLAMHLQHIGFVDAVRWLAQTFCVTITDTSAAVAMRPHQPMHAIRQTSVTNQPVSATDKPAIQPDIPHLSQLVCQPYLNEEARRFLFDERKIHPGVVSWLGLSSISSPVPMSRDYRCSWYNGPSLLIPYRSVDGKLMSVQARYLGSQAGKPRFQFPRGSSCHIYNLPVLNLLKPQEPLYITEGVSDCMAMLSAGHKAVAIPSATLLKAEDADLLRQLPQKLGTTFHMYPDQDAPGANLYLDLKSLLGEVEYIQLPEGYKDFGQYWASR